MRGKVNRGFEEKMKWRGTRGGGVCPRACVFWCLLALPRGPAHGFGEGILLSSCIAFYVCQATHTTIRPSVFDCKGLASSSKPRQPKTLVEVRNVSERLEYSTGLDLNTSVRGQPRYGYLCADIELSYLPRCLVERIKRVCL